MKECVKTFIGDIFAAMLVVAVMGMVVLGSIVFM